MSEKEKKEEGEFRTISGRTISGRPPWKPAMQNIPYGDGSFTRSLRQAFIQRDKKRRPLAGRGYLGWGVFSSGESRGVETVYPVPAGQTEAEVLVAALEIAPEARWPYERAVKVFNEHCPQVCDLFREKFSTQAEYNAAYREEMNKRLAHTGWTEAQITARIFDQAAAGMEAYYTPMRLKP